MPHVYPPSRVTTQGMSFRATTQGMLQQSPSLMYHPKSYRPRTSQEKQVIASALSPSAA